MSFYQNFFKDKLVNLLSGMGVFGRDKTVGSVYVQSVISKGDLDSAYRTDWIARKVVDIPPQDATRAWRAWKSDTKTIGILETYERKLDLQRKLRKALTWSRLYGGSALVMGINGDTASELDVESVGKDDLKFVHVVSRWGLGSGPIIRDVMSPYFGMPEYFTRTVDANPNATQIHPSRVIMFHGMPIPDDNMTDIWGDSVLQTIMDSIQAATTVTQSVATMVTEAKLDVIHVPELSRHIASQEYKDLLTDRFMFANAAKSVINTILLDKEEEWQRISTEFNSLPDIIRMFLLMVSGAADIPATRMLGQSPAGLSSTGDSDVRNYYDRVASDQANDLTPALTRLDQVLVRSSLGTYPDIYYDWRPLWQMDETLMADIAKKKAETFKIDVDVGIIDPEALRIGRQNQLIEDGTYPGLEAALDAQEQLSEESMIPPDEQEPDILPGQIDPNAPPAPAPAKNGNGAAVN